MTIKAAETRRNRERDDPVLFAEGLGFTADGWQQTVLQSSSSRLILCAGRQVGKSSVVALAALHHAIFTPNALVIVVAPGLRQSCEVFSKIVAFALRYHRGREVREHSLLRLVLNNGSRLLALPGDGGTTRGYSPTLCLFDEAGYASDETFNAISPSLAVTGGRMVLLSSPRGKRGFFYQTWQADNGWQKIRVRSDECPRISREFLQRERLSLPPTVYRSEYEAEFTDCDESLFLIDEIEACATRRPVEVPEWAL